VQEPEQECDQEHLQQVVGDSGGGVNLDLTPRDQEGAGGFKQSPGLGPGSAPPALSASPPPGPGSSPPELAATLANLSPSNGTSGSSPAVASEATFTRHSAPTPGDSPTHRAGAQAAAAAGTPLPPAPVAATTLRPAASPARSLLRTSADDLPWDPACPPALKQLIVSCLRDDAQVSLQFCLMRSNAPVKLISPVLA
jgi:hypothetical protein